MIAASKETSRNAKTSETRETDKNDENSTNRDKNKNLEINFVRVSCI